MAGVPGGRGFIACVRAYCEREMAHNLDTVQRRVRKLRDRRYVQESPRPVGPRGEQEGVGRSEEHEVVEAVRKVALGRQAPEVADVPAKLIHPPAPAPAGRWTPRVSVGRQRRVSRSTILAPPGLLLMTQASSKRNAFPAAKKQNIA